MGANFKNVIKVATIVNVRLLIFLLNFFFVPNFRKSVFNQHFCVNNSIGESRFDESRSSFTALLCVFVKKFGEIVKHVPIQAKSSKYLKLRFIAKVPRECWQVDEGR